MSRLGSGFAIFVLLFLAEAKGLIVENPNFDNGSSGWSAVSNFGSSVWSFETINYGAFYGGGNWEYSSRMATFFTGGNSVFGQISQPLSYSLQPSTTYTLSFLVLKADSLSVGVPSVGALLSVGGSSLTWDTSITPSISTGGTLWTFSLTTPSTSPLLGQQISLELNARTSGFFSGGIVSQRVSFDNVVLQAVPEPSVYALLAVAAAGLVLTKLLRNKV